MKNKLLKITTFSVMAWMLCACNPLADEVKETAKTQAAPPPTEVSSIKVRTEDIPVHYIYVGQVAGSLEVEVRSRITGIIEQRHFKEGSEVEQGQLLFSIDAAPFEAEYKQAEAAIVSAKAQKLTAQAQLKQAKRELKRVSPLANQQMLSQNQRDDAASAVDIAQAQVVVADAAIKQAEANLLSAGINLDYTRIRAPIKGVIGRSLQNRGALVQADGNSLLTTLVQLDSVHVDFGIPENEELRIRDALRRGEMILNDSGFTVALVDEKGNSSGHNGTLDFQDYKVDNQTGNFAMRATIDNQDRHLSPGQFVRVQLNGAVKSSALAIPQRAVLDGPAGKYVYVVTPTEQGATVAMQKSITLGEWVDLDEGRDNYWIVEQGLQAGDEVIVDGVARIFFPGMPVKVSQQDTTKTAEAS